MSESGSQDPISQLLDWLTSPWDSWASVPAPIPYPMFGRGSRHPFSWYFDGVSQVSVSNVGDLERWLLGCEYVSDRSLFGQDDYWQHPGEFEQIRMGDCDDHALWAWRKLVGLEFPTSLVAGKWLTEPGDLHVWLLTSVSGQLHIFEATSKVLGEALRPFENVRDRYVPYFSVDERFRTRAHLGGVQGFFRVG